MTQQLDEVIYKVYLIHGLVADYMVPNFDEEASDILKGGIWKMCDY